MEEVDDYIRTIGWWFRGLDEKEQGPYSLKSIRGYYAQCIINADTEIRQNTDDYWKPAGDVAEITQDIVPVRIEQQVEKHAPDRKRERELWRAAAEGEIGCIRHRNRKAITVCHRCHAPVCEKDLHRPGHWMCKSCHSYLYNRRTIAGLVDYLLIPLVMNLAVQLSTTFLGVYDSAVAFAGFMGLAFGALALITIYSLFKDYLFAGRSLGKLLCAIRVVDVNSKEPCLVIQSIKRNALLAATWLPLCSLIFGIWWLVDIDRAFYDPRGRRDFDKWAGTIVVDIPGKVERARQVTHERLVKQVSGRE